jgi:hypothetical protein
MCKDTDVTQNNKVDNTSQVKFTYAKNQCKILVKVGDTCVAGCSPTIIIQQNPSALEAYSQAIYHLTLSGAAVDEFIKQAEILGIDQQEILKVVYKARYTVYENPTIGVKIEFHPRAIRVILRNKLLYATDPKREISTKVDIGEEIKLAITKLKSFVNIESFLKKVPIEVETAYDVLCDEHRIDSTDTTYDPKFVCTCINSKSEEMYKYIFKTSNGNIVVGKECKFCTYNVTQQLDGYTIKFHLRCDDLKITSGIITGKEYSRDILKVKIKTWGDTPLTLLFELVKSIQNLKKQRNEFPMELVLSACNQLAEKFDTKVFIYTCEDHSDTIIFSVTMRKFAFCVTQYPLSFADDNVNIFLTNYETILCPRFFTYESSAALIAETVGCELAAAAKIVQIVSSKSQFESLKIVKIVPER